MSYAERQRYLMDTFSFTYLYELYSLPLITRNGSDHRLDQIQSIDKDLTNQDQVLKHPSKYLG